MKKCYGGNHTIGVDIDDKIVTTEDYIKSGKEHPGRFIKYCMNCGKNFGCCISTMTEDYEPELFDD